MTNEVVITRYVRSVAYARNGNAHNPTVTYWWRCSAGRFPTLREAKEVCTEVFPGAVVRVENDQYIAAINDATGTPVSAGSAE